MKIVVTRPLPQAEQTAARLRALGHESFLLPLTEIVPSAPAVSLDSLAACDIVAATSANAFIHLPDPYARAIRDKPVFTVGDATAHAALVAGFSDVESAGADAQALATQIARDAPNSRSVAYLCGRLRRPDFEQAMAQAGFAVMVAETYDTLPVAYAPHTIRAALADGPAAILLYSVMAAERLLAQADAEMLDDTVFCCLSSRIARPLVTASHGTIRIAAAPDEDSLLACLDTA